ncbi:glycolate oxidase subunit GlcE [Rhodoferax fermentans]|uniref:Glycolate oxidase subunit GlcE n=1 Tax=Rhodoferax fermentans TaxID=28066 RepID=A0A1T1AUE0_RHOFE|nr:glycolate oxidase subunit GlcE [Rhodoferax fermentans]MBK1685347.1 glycolate oxidase subunit GlcE [Rhodoferax fermentans]OOV07595.1 glycolate oxidase subunit GlcE [Rhodoferax fermentans]
MTDTLPALIDTIRAAAAAHTPLRIRGHGSKDFYGELLQGELLDTSGHTGIVSYEPTELVITARAGTPLTELEATLAQQGQCLAFEPPRFGGRGTVGGMVAAGLSGPSRASVGGVRDYVLGLQMVNGRAEHLIFGGQVMKNVAGYDLSRLMVGSLGILGLLTEVSLKVMPQPAAEATLVFEVDQARALEQLHRWGAQPLPLNASRWEQGDHEPGEVGQLFVRLRGAGAAVDSAITRMTQDLPGHTVDPALASADWTACRDQTLPFFDATAHPGQALWRLSLPQTAPGLNLLWPQLVEWHGGLRWVWAPESAAAKLRDLSQAVGGTTMLFRANNPDSTRASDRFEPLERPLDQIHTRLKAEFDPANIFNPGRMFRSL